MNKIGAFLSAGVMIGTSAFAAAPEFYRSPSLAATLPFSSAVIVGDTIYLSGHLGRDPETNILVAGGAGPQTRQTMANIEMTLAAVGAELTDVVKCTVFLDDLADYQAMNDAYAEAFPGPKPARSTIGADGLALGAAVEIECIAVRDGAAKSKASE